MRIAPALTLLTFAACAARGGPEAPPPIPEVAEIDHSPVFVSPRRAPPISGGTLTVMSDRTVVAADPDRDRVWILDPLATAAREVVLADGDEPGRVVEGPLGRAFVGLRSAGAVAEVDLATATVVARHDACPAVRGLAWSGDKKLLTVACATGTLARLKFDVGPAGLSLISRVLQHLGDDLRDVVQRKDDVLVSTFRTARVFLVTDDGTAISPQPPMFTSETRQVAWRMIAGPQPGQALILGQHEVTNPGEDYGDTNGKQAVKSDLFTLSGTIGEPEGAVLAVDVALSPAGRWAVAAPGNATVVRQNFVGSTVLKPRGEPVALAFRGPEELVVFSREPAQLEVFAPEESVPVVIPLPGVSMRSTGHALFHRATAGGIACASCHPEAGDDGHTWQLPEGTRRTNPLRGGLKSTEPFHWRGDRKDITALIDEVMVNRMKGDRPPLNARNAMLDWLDAVPALPPPAGLDAAAVARGKTLFDSPERGCLACHPGPLGTDNLSHDVGTGGYFQSPRLVEIAGRAPYLHDGRAKTLKMRFEADGPDQRHGKTAALSDAELGDLVEYLKSR